MMLHTDILCGRKYSDFFLYISNEKNGTLNFFFLRWGQVLFFHFKTSRKNEFEIRKFIYKISWLRHRNSLIIHFIHLLIFKCLGRNDGLTDLYFINFGTISNE